MKKTWLRWLQCLALCVCLLTTALPVEAKAEEGVQDQTPAAEGTQAQTIKVSCSITDVSGSLFNSSLGFAELELSLDVSGQYTGTFEVNDVLGKWDNERGNVDIIWSDKDNSYLVKDDSSNKADELYRVKSGSFVEGQSSNVVFVPADGAQNPPEIDYYVSLERCTAAEEGYTGVLNREDYSGYYDEDGMNPISYDSLTPAQQAVMKPLYDALGAVDLNRTRDVVEAEERAICQGFVNGIMGREIPFYRGENFFGFQRVVGGSANRDANFSFLGYAPNWIVIELKEDGTWKDVELAGIPANTGTPDLYLEPMANPVLIAIVEQTDDKKLNQIYYKSPTEQPSTGATAIVNGQIVPVYVNEVGANATEAQKAELDAFWQSIGSTDGLTEEQKAEKERQAYTGLFKKHGTQSMKLTGSYGSMDLVLPGVEFPVEGLTITFPANSVKPSDRVVVLHLRADGVWETIGDAVAGEGTITGTFTSLSPVFYAVVTEEQPGTPEPEQPGQPNEPEQPGQPNEPEQPGQQTSQPSQPQQGTPDANSGAAPSAANTMISPKTGEAELPYLAVLVMLCAVGGLVLTAGRRMARK